MAIYWTDKEKTDLAASTFAMLKKDPSLSEIQCLNLAQKALPPSRQRLIVSKQSIPWLFDELKILRNLDFKRISNSETHIPVKPDAKPMESKPSVDLNKLFDELISRALKSFIVEITPIIEKAIESKIKSLNLAETIAEYLDTKPPEIKLDKRKKKMVLLINLMPVQFADVSKEFSRVLDLKMWSDEGGYDQLRSLCFSASRIYGMTDHMSHKIDGVIKNTNAGAYVRFSGGISTLKDMLRVLCLEEDNENNI